MPEIEDYSADYEFRDKRMVNACYWKAQATEFMRQQVHGLSGEWGVEVLAGRAVIVMSDEFPDGGIEALETELHDHNFPEFETKECTLDDETRIFIEPSDDRLKSPLEPDWLKYKTW